MKHAFSLVELSIVLVILGLLVGGILTGQSLIRAAELRSTIADAQQYRAAVFTFREKYFSLPGDMANATDFWGSAGGGGVGASCFTAAVTDQTTCNGDGDGYTGSPEGATSSDIWYKGEAFMAWKHLANAGLVEGSYTGRTNHATHNNYVTAGVNTPPTAIGAFQIGTVSGASPSWFNPLRSQKTALILASDSTDATAPLLPQEAWNVDKKLDDGLPAKGFIATIHYDHADGKDCADNADPEISRYQIDSDTKGCSLIMYFF